MCTNGRHCRQLDNDDTIGPVHRNNEEKKYPFVKLLVKQAQQQLFTLSQGRETEGLIQEKIWTF